METETDNDRWLRSNLNAELDLHPEITLRQNCRGCGDTKCLDEYGLCRHCAAARYACETAGDDYADGYDF